MPTLRRSNVLEVNDAENIMDGLMNQFMKRRVK